MTLRVHLGSKLGLAQSGLDGGKGYELERGLGAELWAEVRLRLQGYAVFEGPAQEPSSLYGEPTLIRPRMGQGTSRTVITDTYERRCAVTDEKALPALDAAHIRSVKSGGRHLVRNGLLLRSDVHRLFDAGYVTVTPRDSASSGPRVYVS